MEMNGSDKVVFVPHVGTYWVYPNGDISPIHIEDEVEAGDYKALEEVMDFEGVTQMSLTDWIETAHNSMNKLSYNPETGKYLEDVSDHASKHSVGALNRELGAS